MVSKTATQEVPITAASDEARMPFMLHLKELRDRIMRSVIVLVVTVMASMFLVAQRIIDLLVALAPAEANFTAIKVMETMIVWLKVSLWSGFIVAMPYLFYQFFAYIAPGLTSKEKRLIFFIIPAIVLMFLLGVAFAYFVALRPALGFLLRFEAGGVVPTVSIEDYISVVTRMLLVVGLIFETPLVVMALARLGVVSPQWLAKQRRLMIVIAFIVSALATPTMDPINQSIIAIPMILLLELGIQLAKMVYKKKRVAVRGG